MTALAGTWRFADKGADEERCRMMLAAQARYGTGPESVWAAKGLCLGRRLTATLPEDRHDRGVEVSRDGSLRMIADVRIDNRAEFAETLGLSPADAAGLSDSALLMSAWQRWSERALQHVVGDFALAVWDGEQLVLARDFPGQRPLFYWQSRDQVAFASMPCGLLALPEVAPQADERSLERFARHARPDGDATFVTGIRRVAPGQTIMVTPDTMRKAAHWELPRGRIAYPRDEDYVEAVREILDRAVAARMRGSETGLACHLSAGLDSSAVATSAARLHTSTRPISAITVVPRGDFRAPRSDRLLDERTLAAATASLHDSLDHVVVERADRSPIEHFEDWLELFQRPAPDVANQDWYAGANDAAMARGISILLHGQAGNFTFSHAGRELLADLLARGRLDLWWREAMAMTRAGVPPRTSLTRSLAPFIPRPLWAALAVGRGRRVLMTDHSLVRAAAASIGALGGRQRGEVDYTLQPQRRMAEVRIETLADADFGTINKGLLARWGIDARDPLADRRMIELTLRLPPSQFERNGISRSLARRALEGRAPAELLAERRRGYQSADWLSYLTTYRSAIAAEAERQRRYEATGFLDAERIRDRLNRWPSNGDDPDARRLYRTALMAALSAGHFARSLG